MRLGGNSTFTSMDTRPPIICNDKILHVGEYLYDFLLRFRRGPAWINAICINQSVLDEPTQQVGMMKLIYQTAASMILWLGEFEYLSSRSRKHLDTLPDVPAELTATVPTSKMDYICRANLQRLAWDKLYEEADSASLGKVTK